MDEKEIASLMERLRATGMSDEEIMDSLYQAFEKGEMDRKDLETLAGHLGYELTDDFKNEPTPDPINGGGGEVTKEQAENAKEIEPGESADEFRESIGEDKGGNTDSESDDESEEEDPFEKGPKKAEKGEDFDEDEWKEAQKLFGI